MTEQPKPIFLLMPEWQGSASTRAMQLTEGARVLAEDLPRAARFDVAVPQHAGDSLGTPVARLSAIVSARDAARELLRERGNGSPAITVGGDCASTLAGLEHALQRDADSDGTSRTAVIWFDAHPDLQHPATSPSGAASGMALRHALGEGTADLAFARPLDPTRVLLVGARDIDDEEATVVDALGIRQVSPLDAATPEQLAAEVEGWLAETDASHVYVHIDLDVLDPADFASVHQQVPFGLSLASLTQAIRAAVSRAQLAGAAICEFAPATDEMASDDAPAVLRVLGALLSGANR